VPLHTARRRYPLEHDVADRDVQPAERCPVAPPQVVVQRVADDVVQGQAVRVRLGVRPRTDPPEQLVCLAVVEAEYLGQHVPVHPPRVTAHLERLALQQIGRAHV
jgi:hypothetical protein